MEGESEGQREKTRAQESERTFTRVREPGAQARERSYQPISLSVSLYLFPCFSLPLSLPPPLALSYQPSSGRRNKADDHQHRDFGAQPHAPHPSCGMHAKLCVSLGRCAPLG